MASSNPLNSGSFVPSTNIWDVSQIYDTPVTSPEFKELLVRLYQNVNNIAISLNTRDAGFYAVTEFVNGQVWFPNPALMSGSPTSPVLRQVFRKVINFGALPNNTTISVAHNIPINIAYTFTRIYGTASNTSGLTYIPLPYSSSVDVAHNIELSVTSTDVVIATGSNYSTYTITYIVLEYIKS